MPYILKNRREKYTESIDHITNELKQLGFEKGDLNYVITKLVLAYCSEHGIRYNTLSDVTGILNDVKSEFERRVVAPYEDKKIKENGDAYDKNIF